MKTFATACAGAAVGYAVAALKAGPTQPVLVLMLLGGALTLLMVVTGRKGRR